MKRRIFNASVLAALTFAPAFAAASPMRVFFRGEEVRLSDILLPQTGEAGSSIAEGLLQTLLEDANRMEETASRDRWERPVARIHLKSRTGVFLNTIQERLVAAGAARVAPESDDHPFIARLLNLETAARRSRAGLWASRRMRPFSAHAARGAVGAYNIVEGAPLQAIKRGGRIYLNFGEDYREDFTATARSVLARRWAKQSVDLLTMQGRRMSVRGYVAWINGPSIEVKHPLQIELLDTSTPLP